MEIGNEKSQASHKRHQGNAFSRQVNVQTEMLEVKIPLKTGYPHQHEAQGSTSLHQILTLDLNPEQSELCCQSAEKSEQTSAI